MASCNHTGKERLEGLKSWGRFASPVPVMETVTSARGEGTGNVCSGCSSQGVRPWREVGSGCAGSPAVGDPRSHLASKPTGCSHHLWLEWIYVLCIQTLVGFVPTSLCRQPLSNRLAQSDLPTWLWVSTRFPSWLIVLLLNIAQLS